MKSTSNGKGLAHVAVLLTVGLTFLFTVFVFVNSRPKDAQKFVNSRPKDGGEDDERKEMRTDEFWERHIDNNTSHEVREDLASLCGKVGYIKKSDEPGSLSDTIDSVKEEIQNSYSKEQTIEKDGESGGPDAESTDGVKKSYLAKKQTDFLSERLQFIDKIIEGVHRKGITMVSRERMANVRDSALAVINQGIEGDFVETGTWQGGCSVVMRAVNAVMGDTVHRANWLFDTFEGLPAFDERDTEVEKSLTNPSDRKMDPEGSYAFEGGLDTVKRHFIDLLGDDFINLNFQKGFFKDTVPVAKVEKIAMLRLDGDMYSSTMDVLNVFYDKVVSGGYIIIDDYGHWPQCKKAIHDFFR